MVLKNKKWAMDGYVTLRGVNGGVKKVYEGDMVMYNGKEWKVAVLAYNNMTDALLEDDGGREIVVKMSDVRLKAV